MAAAKADRYRSVLSLARVFVLLALEVAGMLEVLGISVVAELVSGCGVVAGSVIVFVARRYGTELVTPSIVVIGISLGPIIMRGTSCFAVTAAEGLFGRRRVARGAYLTPFVEMLLGRSAPVLSARV
jgi:hypothetical protein